MKMIGSREIVAASLILVVTGGGGVSARGDDPDANRKKQRWNRVLMAAEVGGMALGVATFNPGLVGASAGALGGSVYQQHKRSKEAERAATTSPSGDPRGSLVAVPGRAGFFHDPSNPNQLYYDANAIATAEPMQAKLPEPARINVLIANTAKDGRTVRYSVSGTDYEVPPGYLQALAAPAASAR